MMTIFAGGKTANNEEKSNDNEAFSFPFLPFLSLSVYKTTNNLHERCINPKITAKANFHNLPILQPSDAVFDSDTNLANHFIDAFFDRSELSFLATTRFGTFCLLLRRFFERNKSLDSRHCDSDVFFRKQNFLAFDLVSKSLLGQKKRQQNAALIGVTGLEGDSGR